MKIPSIVNNIKTDIYATGERLKNAGLVGYDIADRTAKIYNQNNIIRYINITRSVGDKIIKGSTINELPYLAGALGMFVPLPLASPVLLGLGFIIRLAAVGFNNKKI